MDQPLLRHAARAGDAGTAPRRAVGRAPSRRPTRAHRARCGAGRLAAVAAGAGASVSPRAQATRRVRGARGARRLGAAAPSARAAAAAGERRGRTRAAGSGALRAHRAAAGSVLGVVVPSAAHAHGRPAPHRRRGRRAPARYPRADPRRHRVGEDAGVSRGAAPGGGGRAGRDPARPRNRFDAADGGAGARRVRRPSRGVALRPFRRRARRRVARAAQRRAVRRGRRPVGDLRAGPAPRRHRRGRRARGELQAGDGPALPRARRRRRARAPRGRPAAPGERDALARGAALGRDRTAPRLRAPGAHRGSSAAAGRRCGPA